MVGNNSGTKSASELVHARVLSRDPIVIYGFAIYSNMLAHATAMSPLLRGRRAHFLISNSWSLEVQDRIRNAAGACIAHRETYPEHDLTFLCNSPAELEGLRQCGIKSELINQSVFMSEELFRVMPEEAKRFDAVYNARMIAFKRHSLAAEIDSLLLIYYVLGEADIAYHNGLRPRMPRATFLNGRPGEDYRRLNARDVARNLNACRVGLCLSKIEGAMMASMEYLLCGLPVVTTPSKGGRDLFLDGAFSLTVEPDAQAIKRAVRELVEARIDPQFVRDKTLHKIRAERERFIGLVQAIFDQEGIRRRFRDDWPKIYVNKLFDWDQKPDDMLRGAGLL